MNDFHNNCFVSYWSKSQVFSKIKHIFIIYLLCLGLSACTSSVTRPHKTEIPQKFTCADSQQPFFFPMEFDQEGNTFNKDKFQAMMQSLARKGVKDVYIFVHGWGKTITDAEDDYGKLICKFYKMGNTIYDSQNPAKASLKDAVVIGLFWPSTVFPDTEESYAVKPVSYPIIRERADHLATTGFQELLFAIQALSKVHTGPLRIHIVGHSFGGRIITTGLFSYLTNPKNNPQELFEHVDQINFILLLPAMPNDALDSGNLKDDVEKEVNKLSDNELIGKEKVEEYEKQIMSFEKTSKEVCNNNGPALGGSGRDILCAFSLGGIGAIKIDRHCSAKTAIEERTLRGVESLRELNKNYPPLRVFTIFSDRDWANNILFPIGSTLAGKDHIGCALGGCGASNDIKTIIDAKGHLAIDDNLVVARMFGVDATSIISDHTDIYKDEIADLIWKLINKEQASRDTLKTSKENKNWWIDCLIKSAK